MQRKKIKINFVDFWSNFDIKDNSITKILNKHYDVEISNKPDFLFCSCFGEKHLLFKNCVKIFYAFENVLPDFNKYDYASAYDFIQFSERYFRHTYVVPKPSFQIRKNITSDLFNRKFCNFIYSNESCGKGALLRKEFCKKLMLYKHIDCPGKVLNNMNSNSLSLRYSQNWEESKRDFLKQYKFTIAFENSCSDGYTTEKLFDPLLSYSIPIYWGNPKVDIDFNKKAFINILDFKNLDEAIKKIIELDNNPQEYLKILSESPMNEHFDFNQDIKHEQWLLSIIQKGNHSFVEELIFHPLNQLIKQKKSIISLFGLKLLSVKTKNDTKFLKIFGIKIKIRGKK